MKLVYETGTNKIIFARRRGPFLNDKSMLNSCKSKDNHHVISLSDNE